MVEHPIGAMQKHDAWAASDIADLTNKIAIVSGSTSGLGFAATTELARHRAHVVQTARTT